MGKYRDLTNKKFGRLTVIRDVGRVWGNVLWECKCDCGNIVNIPSFDLCSKKKRVTRSCGCIRKEQAAKRFGKELVGQTFHRLTVISRIQEKSKRRKWLCRCICGKEVVVTSNALTSGGTKSCGCLQREKAAIRMKQFGKAQRGEKHPFWKGGIKAAYPADIWTAHFTTKIRKRDGYSCRICGVNRIGLDIHHIDENKDNCNENNLITLCRKCHKNVHHGHLTI